MKKRGQDSYVVRVAGGTERVELRRCGSKTIAVAYRFGRQLVSFMPGPIQKRKIEAKRGEVRISAGQISRVPDRCAVRR